MKANPTVVGTLTTTPAATRILPTTPVGTTTALVPAVTSKITLRPDQMILVEADVAKLDFSRLPPGDVIRLGQEAEMAFHKTLDSFLALIDKNKSPKIFELLGRVQKGVDEAELPGLLEKIQDTRVGFFAGIINTLRSREARAEAARQAYQATVNLVAGRTKTLVDELGKLEREMTAEQQVLFRELEQMARLKDGYRDHLGSFAISAATTMAFLEKARAFVEQKRLEAQSSTDPLVHHELRDYDSKLQLLESRALALEGTFTRLPGEQEVIRQIENAGVMTLQENIITAGQRFANIKTTLLALNATLRVRGVQRLGESQAKMESDLAKVRASAMGQVVTAAANAPGDNRQMQADQIKAIIEEAKMLNEIVATAKVENAKKFDAARTSFAESRDEMVKLSQTH